GAVSRHDDNLCIRIDRLDLFEKLETGFVSEVNVTDEDVKFLLAQGAARLLSAVCQAERVGFHLEDGPHQLADGTVVIDDQHFRFRIIHRIHTEVHIQGVGIDSVNTDPFPTSLSTTTSPPCRSATSLTKARPRPKPLCSRVSLFPRR